MCVTVGPYWFRSIITIIVAVVVVVVVVGPTHSFAKIDFTINIKLC